MDSIWDERQPHRSQERLRNHANIEGMQGMIFQRITEHTGVMIPPKVRNFISALQGSHGGGSKPFEPFKRGHLAVAKCLQFKGSDESKQQRVRRLIKALEEYQAGCGLRLVGITRGGNLRRDERGELVYTATEYIDNLGPVADEAVMKARNSEEWKTHPGKAMSANVDWAMSQLERFEPEGRDRLSCEMDLPEYIRTRHGRQYAQAKRTEEGIEKRGGGNREIGGYLRNLASALLREADRLDGRKCTEITAKLEEILVGTSSPPSAVGIGSNGSPPLSAPVIGTIDISGEPAASSIPAIPKNDASGESGSAELQSSSVAMVDVGPSSAVPSEIIPATTNTAAIKFQNDWAKLDKRAATQQKLSAALRYAREFGWRIIPVRPNDKKPYIRDWPHLASNDADQINTWWRKYPDANVGILTGASSGFFALDVDPRNGGDESLSELISSYGPLPCSIKQRTGGGGKHFLFKHPGSRLKSTNRLGRGLDIKADGGYIVVPPSLFPGGQRYAWIGRTQGKYPGSREGSDPWENPEGIIDTPPIEVLSEAPAWLLELIARPVHEVSSSRSLLPSARARIAAGRDAAGNRDLITEGNRNDFLFKCASSKRGLGGGRDDILNFLLQENSARCQPPLQTDEVIKIVDNVITSYKPNDQGKSSLFKLALELFSQGKPEHEVFDALQRKNNFTPPLANHELRGVVESARKYRPHRKGLQSDRAYKSVGLGAI